MATYNLPKAKTIKAPARTREAGSDFFKIKYGAPFRPPAGGSRGIKAAKTTAPVKPKEKPLLKKDKKPAPRSRDPKTERDIKAIIGRYNAPTKIKKAKPPVKKAKPPKVKVKPVKKAKPKTKVKVSSPKSVYQV